VPWVKRLVADLSPRRPGSIAGQSMRDLWFTTWYWDRLFYEYFGFPVRVIPSCSILIHSFVRSFIHAFIRSFITNAIQSSRLTASLNNMLKNYILLSIYLNFLHLYAPFNAKRGLYTNMYYFHNKHRPLVYIMLITYYYYYYYYFKPFHLIRLCLHYLPKYYVTF
jgi:hypothetical protein